MAEIAVKRGRHYPMPDGTEAVYRTTLVSLEDDQHGRLRKRRYFRFQRDDGSWVNLGVDDVARLLRDA